MDDKKKSKLKKAIYLTIIVSLFLIYSGYECRQIRREHRVNETLKQIHQSLQNYHVKYEAYVPGPELKASNLIFHLNKTGFMQEIPINPYTGKAYLVNDPNDRIIYETDELLETFKLKAMNFDDDKILRRMESNGLGQVKEEPQ